jgi:membrane associated rhomboid family serine protease
VFHQTNERLPAGIRNLLIATIGIYIIQILPVFGPWLFIWGALKPSMVLYKAQIWRLVTYLFLHDQYSIWHMMFNMLALWMFGVEIEQRWGTRRFVTFYFLTGIGSGMVSLLLVRWGDVPVIGASGAILGLLTVYAYYFPDRKVLLFFIFPVPVRAAVVIFGVISLFGAVQSIGGIAHLTHLGGILIAILYLKYYNQITSWWIHQQALKAEKIMRHRAEQKHRRDQYIEGVIDPLLKKISEQGMESLTKDEKNTLEHFSKISRNS